MMPAQAQKAGVLCCFSTAAFDHIKLARLAWHNHKGLLLESL
jgi:hypothetical protein